MGQTHEKKLKSAKNKAKKSLQSSWSRERFIISSWKSYVASTSIWKGTGISEKKGWDFAQLGISILIPFLIWSGTQSFNKKQQEIATARYQQEVLTKYFEQISQLLLKMPQLPLNKKIESDREVHTIVRAARARTLSTLNQLNDSDDNSRNDYKGALIKFLVEAELIHEVKPVISLEEADLKHASLSGANLSGANLENADLTYASLFGANLLQANLLQANLNGAILVEANLSKANLFGARLFGANLVYADLSGAYLLDADFLGGNFIKDYIPSGEKGNFIKYYFLEKELKKNDVETFNFLHQAKKDAILFGANLSGAKLPDAKTLSNEQIKSACFWDEAIYTEAEWNQIEEKWILVDEQANQKRIEEIRLDTTSDPDPKNIPNCDEWWRSRSEL